jgi:hypothetical protein
MTYSIARNEELAKWAPRDPSLSRIADADGWKKLISTLLQKKYEVRMNNSKELSDLKVGEFKTAIQDILDRAT